VVAAPAKVSFRESMQPRFLSHKRADNADTHRVVHVLASGVFFSGFLKDLFWFASPVSRDETRRPGLQSEQSTQAFVAASTSYYNVWFRGSGVRFPKYAFD
jgi:hypothetical protein